MISWFADYALLHRFTTQLSTVPENIPISPFRDQFGSQDQDAEIHKRFNKFPDLLRHRSNTKLFVYMDFSANLEICELNSFIKVYLYNTIRTALFDEIV